MLATEDKLMVLDAEVFRFIRNKQHEYPNGRLMMNAILIEFFDEYTQEEICGSIGRITRLLLTKLKVI